MLVERFAENPLITPADVPPSREDYEVVGAFNAGAIDYKDEILLSAGEIVRIPGETWHYLSSDEGSITIPIKQTIKGKKDHYFYK